ncbi:MULTISPECIES: hypothetical protein [Lysobacter]|uniref:Uncharacterized protein n=1 Tax=Lysobacter firmicutimachus TaxID=1792846 RepID=A0ABU8D3R9_9GAMM|nr:hypothetical protein [Lysobacter antibioticus]
MTDMPAPSPIVDNDLQAHIQRVTEAAARAIASLDQVSGDAAGQVAQSAAAYFDSVSQLALASHGVLLKRMTEELVEQHAAKAAEDALGILVSDVLLGAAAAVAAAVGAIEAESAGFAIDRIDQNIAKYTALLQERGG